MSYVRTLLAKLGFEVDDAPLERFNREIDESKGLLEDVRSRAGSLIEKLANLNQVWELTTKVASTAWGVLKGLTLEVSAAGNAINDTSQQIGVGTTELQRLQFAAESTGSSAATMNKVLLEQQKLMRETRMNAATPFGKALEEIGLKLEEIDRLPAEQRLGKIGEALSWVTDDGRKAALSLALFGGEGAKMLPTIAGGTKALKEMGDEGERLGYVMDEKTIASSAELEGTIKSLQQTVQGIKNEIASALMPTIAKLAGELKVWIQQNRELIRDNIKGFIEGLISAGKSLAPIVTTAAGAVKTLIEALGGAEKAIGPVTLGLGAMRVATMAALGPWGLLAGAAVTAGAAIYNAMTDAQKSIESTERAAKRLKQTLEFERGFEGKSSSELRQMKADIDKSRRDNRFVRENVRGLTPKQIMALNEERKLDVEELDKREAALDAAIAAAEKIEGEQSRLRGEQILREQAEADAKREKESQEIADREELRYLRRKRGKTREQIARIKELEKELGETPRSGGGKKAEAGDKQKSADELVLAASGRSAGGVLGATAAPSLGTTVNNVSIYFQPNNTIGPFTLPPYALGNPESFGRAAGEQTAGALDAQNRELAAYLQNPRSGRQGG